MKKLRVKLGGKQVAAIAFVVVAAGLLVGSLAAFIGGGSTVEVDQSVVLLDPGSGKFFTGKSGGEKGWGNAPSGSPAVRAALVGSAGLQGPPPMPPAAGTSLEDLARAGIRVAYVERFAEGRWQVAKPGPAGAAPVWMDAGSSEAQAMIQAAYH